ncbi:MAG TPA: ATP-binding protein, partial [Candidatus Polarisedimenticolia bacterium]|nr:ATP-binding protein [Candidatus Polarisedimenticolia bacterium]
CRLFGRERAGIEGRSIDELLAAGHPLRLLLDEVLSGGRSISSRRIALDVEGASVTFMTTLNLIQDPARPSGVMVIARDLDRLTRLGSHLAYAQKLTALGELTSGVAHEIKGPLNAMVIHASLLKEKLGDAGEGIERHVDVLLRQIRHLEQVVQGFLRFTRPEKPRFERVDLGDVIDDAMRELGERAGLDGIRVERHIPSGLPQVHGDRHLLAQAVYNLLDNARHAMRGVGVLRIACQPAAGGRVALRIEDSGVGMPQHVLPKIFDLFYTTSESGSGIGLSLVYRIVQLHGGEIAVESVPGEGSRFTIDLPEASI